MDKLETAKRNGIKHYVQMYLINNHYAVAGKPLPYTFDTLASSNLTLCYAFDYDSIIVGEEDKGKWHIVCTYNRGSDYVDQYIYDEETEEICFPWEVK